MYRLIWISAINLVPLSPISHYMNMQPGMLFGFSCMNDLDFQIDP
jgi:hypothetical protein